MSDWNSRMQQRMQEKKELREATQVQELPSNDEDYVIVKLPKEFLTFFEMPMININPEVMKVAGRAEIAGKEYYMLTSEN